MEGLGVTVYLPLVSESEPEGKRSYRACTKEVLPRSNVVLLKRLRKAQVLQLLTKLHVLDCRHIRRALPIECNVVNYSTKMNIVTCSQDASSFGDALRQFVLPLVLHGPRLHLWKGDFAEQLRVGREKSALKKQAGY